MCAINPTHKTRFVIDVYTSDARLSKKTFDDTVMKLILEVEVKLNSTTPYRWHVKTTNQPAA